MVRITNIFISKAQAICVGFFFISLTIFAQQLPSSIDKLEILYESKKFIDTNELIILNSLSRDSNDPQKKLKYSQLLIELATQKDSTHYLFDAFMQKGNAHRLKSDLSLALKSFLKASELAKGNSESEEMLALSSITIADVYSVMGNHDNSVNYYKQGIAKLREIKSDSFKLASALLNAGDEFFSADKYDEAMTYFYESSLISNKIGFKLGKAYNLGNIGMVYAKQGRHKLARANIDEAIKILELEKDYYPIAVYLEFIADIYLDQNKPVLSKIYAERSLELSKKYQLKEQISTASLKLSKIYDLLEQPKKSLFHLKEYIVYQDSVTNIQTVQKLANLRTEFEIEKKQSQLDASIQNQQSQKYIILSICIVILLLLLLAFGLFRRNNYIKKTSTIIEQEKKRSDNLLLNLLPEESAKELKVNGYVTSKKFESVTVLFTDFKDFTKFAETLSPEKLVESLDFYFSKFDEICEKYNLEKIKTIGDAYMCVGGLPTPNFEHAENVANAALEILDFVKLSKLKHDVGKVRFDVRIGVHSGPVVAGVVGKNKFAYDVWGDTVNIASRVESTCEVGKINISESTYSLIQDRFKFEPRGEIKIKNRSALNMYYLLEKA
ncbi:adenylate/guanylate cyclase domain-containing protein [Polaribacter marinivivus]|uniref:Adenylate/guanylate cyclase domain-containing protein n=1 Tax=Polaribacter marinivivus TaxID=1524260 RepID=A0ABV8R4P0_9FLAO